MKNANCSTGPLPFEPSRTNKVELEAQGQAGPQQIFMPFFQLNNVGKNIQIKYKHFHWVAIITELFWLCYFGGRASSS